MPQFARFWRDAQRLMQQLTCRVRFGFWTYMPALLPSQHRATVLTHYRKTPPDTASNRYPVCTGLRERLRLPLCPATSAFCHYFILQRHGSLRSGVVDRTRLDYALPPVYRTAPFSTAAGSYRFCRATPGLRDNAPFPLRLYVAVLPTPCPCVAKYSFARLYQPLCHHGVAATAMYTQPALTRWLVTTPGGNGCAVRWFATFAPFLLHAYATATPRSNLRTTCRFCSARVVLPFALPLPP